MLGTLVDALTAPELERKTKQPFTSKKNKNI
jgi:hypothetical protein